MHQSSANSSEPDTVLDFTAREISSSEESVLIPCWMYDVIYESFEDPMSLNILEEAVLKMMSAVKGNIQNASVNLCLDKDLVSFIVRKLHFLGRLDNSNIPYSSKENKETKSRIRIFRFFVEAITGKALILPFFSFEKGLQTKNVVSFENSFVTLEDNQKAYCIPGEKIEMGSQIKVYVSKVDNNGKNLLVLLSRSHYGFVKRLFELEIPEINDGTVMIYSVARDPGNRSKVAVYSENPNVDPIGACIGEKGSRIAHIIEELHGEKLDIVKYDSDPAVFIENALSPAKELTVAITDPKKLEAMVIADGDNFSLAIGKKGQNARLATRLTKFRKIDIKTTEQAREAGINFR